MLIFAFHVSLPSSSLCLVKLSLPVGSHTCRATKPYQVLLNFCPVLAADIDLELDPKLGSTFSSRSQCSLRILLQNRLNDPGPTRQSAIDSLASILYVRLARAQRCESELLKKARNHSPETDARFT